jgi:hypothetical protein
MWIYYSEPDQKKFILFVIPICLILLLLIITSIKNLLKEKPDNLKTETISNIRISRAGYRTFDKRLEGTVNGNYKQFLFRGTDREIAKIIKNNNINQVTITYHPSSNRIESIYF